MIYRLLKAGATVTSQDSDGRVLMLAALHRGNSEVIATLLKAVAEAPAKRAEAEDGTFRRQDGNSVH